MKQEDIDICKNISKEIIENVEKSIKNHIGNIESGKFVKMGADGTSTTYIDLIAEKEVIKVLKNANFVSFLISEEIGEIKLGNGIEECINVTEHLKQISQIKELNKENSKFNNDTCNDNIKDNHKFIFLVDPLDGTSNAIKNISAYGISIAIAEIKYGRSISLKDIELGFVKDFAKGDYYEAIKGKGAYLNGEKITSNKEDSLTNLSIGGFIKINSFGIPDLLKKTRRMRVLGSVALELAYIANGKYDAFLDLRGSRIIDIAASKLIAEESGAVVSDENGNDLNNSLNISEKTIVIGASNKKLHEKIIKIINNNKSKDIKKIGIVSRLDKDISVIFAAKLIQFLQDKNIDVSIESSLANKLEGIKNNTNLNKIMENISKSNPNIAKYLNGININRDFNSIGKNISEFDTDMLITLGGDGTLLRGQSQLNNHEIPILGINLGTVGFLTELDIENSFSYIESILNGEYYKEKRTQLKVTHGDQLFTALNEVVIMTEKPAKMLDFEVSVDGEVVEEFRADGLILSTPSGSTAYSMSAGGPIVDPKVGAFIIIPICPYKLGIRPFVVPDSSEIIVKLLKKGKKAVLVMDGQASEKINHLEEIIFKKSENDVYFIRTNDRYFYKKVKEKLTEG